MRKLNIVFFILGMIGFLSAQNGYNIEIKTKGVTKDSIMLSYYGGTKSKTYKVNTVSVQSKKVYFKETNKIISAIYQLHFNDNEENDYVNIAVDNGASLNFELNGDNIKSLKALDELNSLFIQAQTSNDIATRLKLFKEIINKYPNSVASLYAHFEIKEIELPSKTASKDNRNEFRNSYFEGVDLNDKCIPLLPNIYSALYDFVRILPVNTENYNSSIDLLLKDQNCDSRNYMFYLKWVFMNIEYLSQYHMYDSFLYVFNTYLNKGECIVKDENYYKKVVKELQNFEKIPIGSTIPDFKMVDEKGKEMYISAIYPKHDYTFIAFYDPDCSHCKVEIPKINDYFNTLKTFKDVEQIAFLNATSDYAWKYFIEQNKLTNWKHVKSNDTSLQYIRDLDVFANPAFFLVNREGKIILKNYIPEQMTYIFNSK